MDSTIKGISSRTAVCQGKCNQTENPGSTTCPIRRENIFLCSLFKQIIIVGNDGILIISLMILAKVDPHHLLTSIPGEKSSQPLNCFVSTV